MKSLKRCRVILSIVVTGMLLGGLWGCYPRHTSLMLDYRYPAMPYDYYDDYYPYYYGYPRYYYGPYYYPYYYGSYYYGPYYSPYFSPGPSSPGHRQLK